MGTQIVERAVPDSSAAIELRSEGPFAVGAALWRDESDRLFATIVAKVTYAIVDGKFEVVEATKPLEDKDDLAPFKPSNEVLIIGDRRACSPKARVNVGAIEVMVATSPPSERAARPRPEDLEWLADPVHFARPKGFEPSYFLTAPPSQRSSDPFRPDEYLILEDVLDHRRVVARLGGVAPALRVVERVTFVGDTLGVDLDRKTVTLAFRASLPLRNERRSLEVVAEGFARPRASVGPFSEATAEFDRSAFELPASEVIPFQAPSEPAPPRMQGSLAGLPFRQPSSRLSQTGEGEKARARVRPRGNEKDLFGAFFHRGAERIPPKLPPKKESEPTAEAKPPIEPAVAMSARATSDEAASEPVEVNAAFPSPPPIVERPAQPIEVPRPPEVVSAPPPQVAPAFKAPPVAPAPRPLLVLAPPPRPRVEPPVPAKVEERSSPTAREIARERPLGIVRRAIVDLLAFDPTLPARLRRSKRHSHLLSDDLAMRDLDKATRERNEILRVLSCGEPIHLSELGVVLDSALDDMDEWDLPVLLVEGSLRPTMDEAKGLRVAASIAESLAGGSKRALDAVARVRDALKASAEVAPEIATRALRQLHESMRELALPSGYFSDLVERELVQTRSFKKLTLLGHPRIRADLTLVSDVRGTLPFYVSDAAAQQLPMLNEVPIIALVEVRPREDASESNSYALVVLALGRVIKARAR